MALNRLVSMAGTSPRIERILGRASWALWCLLLVGLPVTSFPWLLNIVGGSVVGPLSALPLIPLLILWLGARWMQGSELSAGISILLVFYGIAVVSSALSPFLGIRSFQAEASVDRTIRALATLAVGAGFYLAASQLPRSDGRLRSSLRWIYLGCFVTLLWSSLQIAFIVRGGEDLPYQMRDFHRVFSIRDLHPSRATGFAFEPSWLANQLVVLYVPLLLGSVLRGYSVFRCLRRRLSFELILLAWAGFVLFFSLSRIGFLSLSGIIAVATIILVGRLMARNNGETARNSSARTEKGLVRRRRAVLVLAGFGILVLMVGVLYIASFVDARIARLFRFDFRSLASTRQNPIYFIASRLAFAERLTYWAAGLGVFARFPLIGVGLGNSGFFFPQFVPAFGYGLPEIIRVLLGVAAFPNSKSLWVRLLAETGFIGFAAFAAWLLQMLHRARMLQRLTSPVRSVVGYAGMLALVAQLFEGFSLDTFALPYLWIVLGIVTAASTIDQERHNAIVSRI